jgi:hypothetical protein
MSKKPPGKRAGDVRDSRRHEEWWRRQFGAFSMQTPDGVYTADAPAQTEAVSSVTTTATQTEAISSVTTTATQTEAVSSVTTTATHTLSLRVAPPYRYGDVLLDKLNYRLPE